MATLKRLSVVMSVFGTGILIAACASPTDADLAEESTGTDSTSVEQAAQIGDEAEQAADDVGEEAGDTAEDVREGAEDVGDEAEDSVSQEQRYGWGHRPYRCNYRHVRHCLRNHHGWRWIDLGYRNRPQGGWGHHGWGRRPSFCCMRVHVRDHRY